MLLRSAQHWLGKKCSWRINIEASFDIVGSIVFGLLWIVVLIGDLRRRRVPIPVLLALMLLSLIGQAWPWWLLASAMLLWPSRRSAIMLAPIALGIGVVTNSPAPAMAIAAGSAAWALGWWGGADSIALAALGLWQGLIGLIVGAIATAIAGLDQLLTLTFIPGRSLIQTQ